ncbi:DUF1749 domain-containing protein [Candidatus Woesearchaeota archaeon]|nr:DUF1749 domain-containing protein [Candidatus Woesearchaeota archaeon]
MTTIKETLLKGSPLRIPGTLVEFKTDDGLLLHGFLVGASQAKTCIIYVHGMSGNFYRHQLPFVLSIAARKKGLGFFSMNTRGHDSAAPIYYAKNYTKRKRKNTKKKKKIIGGTNFEKFEDCVFDIRGAMGTLRKMGFRKFVLCGHSTGCQKIAFYQYKTRDRSVAGIILLAPADDYNAHRKNLGKKWKSVVNLCKALIKQGKGNETRKEIPGGFSARRYASIADLQRVESRIFNYDGRLREFSKITVPVFAMFGSEEQYADRPVKAYLSLLKEKTHSKRFDSAIVQKGNHSFVKRENEVAKLVTRWLQFVR